jgi:hypothetical protein
MVDTVHAGYPSRALIGQHKLGDTVAVRTSTCVHKLVQRLDLLYNCKTVPSTVCAPRVSCGSPYIDAGCTV